MSHSSSCGISRRQALKWLGIASVSALAAACGGGPTPTPIVKVVEQTRIVEKKETVEVGKVVEKPVVVTATPAPTVAGADIAADQTLRYMTSALPRLEPASEGGYGRYVLSHLWMPMFLRDSKNNLQPWLASKYEASADLKSYTIYIDPRAVWSDGSPVKAQDAKDYWSYALHPKGCKGCLFPSFSGWREIVAGAEEVYQGKATEVSGIVVKDDKTLQINLLGADPIFVNRLATYNIGFIKMDDLKKGGALLSDDFKPFAVDATSRFNGPFAVKTWDLEKNIFEIVQNPKWWGDKKPKISRIVSQRSADENITLVTWKNNEIDIAQMLSNIKEQIRKETPEAMRLIPYATNFFFYFHPNKPPMDDINVRKALTHAVDWDKAINAAWEGSRNNRVMKTILTPELPCYKAGNWPEYGYDPNKAKEELAKSKYGSADKLPKIRVTPNGTQPTFVRSAEVALEQWKQNLGITNVEMKTGGLDAWGQERNLVNVVRLSLGAGLPDSSNFLNQHYLRLVDPNGPGMPKDADLEVMLDQLRVMKRDDPKYCPLVQQTEARLMGFYPLMPMIWDLYEYCVKPWIKNFDSNVDNNFYTLLDMYIAKH